MQALVLTLAAVTLACQPLAEAAGTPVATGAWGGEHVVMQVTAQGATVEWDCASAHIPQPLVTDSAGAFQTEGTYRREGGPVREDDPGEAARFRGTVSGDRMTLTVTLTGSGHELGTFTLTRGRTPRLFKCQ